MSISVSHHPHPGDRVYTTHYSAEHVTVTLGPVDIHFRPGTAAECEALLRACLEAHRVLGVERDDDGLAPRVEFTIPARS